jgi:hypothetical protein
MTFPTANLRLRDVPLCLFTICGDLDAALKAGGERPDHGRFQSEKLTGVRTRNFWYRAGPAQIARPALSSCFEESAFLDISAAIIISIEVGAFSTRGGSHSVIIDLEDKSTMSGQPAARSGAARPESHDWRWMF